MVEKINLKAIAAMQPQTILWDQEVRGLCARRQFSNVITYSVVFRTQDQTQRWMKLGRHPILTPHLARQKAIEVLRDVTLGKDPAGEREALRSALTVSELCDEYQQHANGKKPTTIKSDNSRIKLHIKPKLGQFKVTSITAEQIEDFMHSLSAGSQKRTVALLGAIFLWAVKRKLRQNNPCTGIEKPDDVRKMRRLSESEYRQLWIALDGDNAAKDVFLFLAVSGWRSSEAINLRWAECDLERKVATLGDTKTGLSVRPLSGAAIKIIRSQSRKTEYVFGTIKKLDYHWNKLGMPEDVSPHTLRHSLASLAADMGISDHLISGLLGHARRSVTSRYMHLSDRALIETADRVAHETLKLMGGAI